jgi:hypothetical protein
MVDRFNRLIRQASEQALAPVGAPTAEPAEGSPTEEA